MRKRGDALDAAARLAGKLQRDPQLSEEKVKEALGNVDRATSCLTLLLLLDSNDPGARELAFRRVWTLGANDRAVRPLAALAARSSLLDSNQSVRNEAAESMSELGRKKDVAAIARVLNDPYWIMRASLADSLGSIGGSYARRLLVKTLREDPNECVRKYAAMNLGETGLAEFLPVLESALGREGANQARAGILGALLALGQNERISELADLLKADDFYARMNAAIELEEAAKRSPEIRERIAPFVPAIEASLEQEETAVRYHLSDLLATLRGGPELAPKVSS